MQQERKKEAVIKVIDTFVEAVEIHAEIWDEYGKGDQSNINRTTTLRKRLNKKEKELRECIKNSKEINK